MTDLLALLWGTVCVRPYVFAFLAVHGWSAIRGLGARRAAALTVVTFSLLITFAIGEVALGLAGLAIAGTLAALLARRAEALPSRAAWAWQRETSHP